MARSGLRPRTGYTRSVEDMSRDVGDTPSVEDRSFNVADTPSVADAPSVADRAIDVANAPSVEDRSRNVADTPSVEDRSFNVGDTPSVAAGFARGGPVRPSPRQHALMLLEHTRRRFGLGALHDASRRGGPGRPRTGYQEGGEVEDDTQQAAGTLPGPQAAYPPDAGGDFTDAGTPPSQPAYREPVDARLARRARGEGRAREDIPLETMTADTGLPTLLTGAARRAAGDLGTSVTGGLENIGRGIRSDASRLASDAADKWGHLKDALASYVRGDNAVPKQELDATRAQTKALNPDLTDAQVNEHIISNDNVPADMRADQLAGMRKEYDGLRTIAQGALAHGAVGEAAQIVEHALNHLPDGERYSIKQDEGGTISVNGTPMSQQQFTDFVGGAATGFDHLMENGADKNIEIASRTTPVASRELAPGEIPGRTAATGYAPGVFTRQPNGNLALAAPEAEQARRASPYQNGYAIRRADGTQEFSEGTPEFNFNTGRWEATTGYRAGQQEAQRAAQPAAPTSAVPAAPGQEGVRPGYKRVYPSTVTVYAGGDRRVTKAFSDTPPGPNDPFYQHPGFEVPDPNYKPAAGQLAPTNAPAPLPKLQTSDPNAGPGHYDQNGFWTGFSGVEGMPHYASQEAHQARLRELALETSQYGRETVGGSRSSSQKTGARGGSETSSHEVKGVPKDFGFDPTTGYGEKFNRDKSAFEKAALEHNSARATAAADKTAQLAAHDVVESLSKDKQQIYQTAREKIKAQTPLDDDEADVLRLVAQQTAAKLRGQPATSAPPAAQPAATPRPQSQAAPATRPPPAGAPPGGEWGNKKGTNEPIYRVRGADGQWQFYQ
jgi:hypothetical protein